MWVIRSKFFGITVFPQKKFDNVIDCSNFIDLNCTIINYLIDRLLYQLYLSGVTVNVSGFIDNSDLKPYNVQQKRFADSFDY